MKETNNIPVNKGHFDLDTPERISEFQKKMACGWNEQDYKDYRTAWVENPQNKIIADYPLQVDIELSSACNLSCPMCYTTTEEFSKSVERKYFDYDLYKQIIDEIAGNIFALRLSWRGESSLHPNFVDAIKYAKDKGIKEVSFLTNCSTFDLDFFKKVAAAGADWISISIDGTGEVYNKIRKPLIFDETLTKIKQINKYKTENNLIKPTIKVQTIWPAIKDNPSEYYNIFKPYTDLIAFNPLIDYLGNDEDIIYEENFCCPQLYQRIFIASNAKVFMCNSDEYGLAPIGDASTETIHEIWHGKKLTSVRQTHNKKDGFKQLPMCKKCFYPRKTEANEEATVNGRKIIIENYINRKQTIGS